MTSKMTSFSKMADWSKKHFAPKCWQIVIGKIPEVSNSQHNYVRRANTSNRGAGKKAPPPQRQLGLKDKITH